MGFRDWLDMQDTATEGLMLPDKPRWVGMSRINPWPCTNAERRRLLGLGRKIKKPDPFGPTVRAVPKVEPPRFFTSPRPRLWTPVVPGFPRG